MWITGVVIALAALSGGPEPWDLARLASYRHQEPVPEARIWFNRGVDPVLRRGERVRVYYRSTVNAYVAILQVDTDGTVRLMYPRSPSENHYARAHRDYRLLFPRSSYWNVGDRPGMGYFFIVTSPRPFDFSDFRYSYYGGGWDLSVVGNRVYKDPYVAMDDYVARLIPDWEYAVYGLDFVSYSVRAPHQYPRFLCYDCHGFKPFNIWDPYRYTCTNFRVVVYDDPYFYPSRRYRGDRVVFVGGSVPSGPRFGFKERARGEPGTPVVRRVPPRGSDDHSGIADGTRGRAVPRGGAGAPEARRPSGVRDASPGDPGARVRPPARRPVLERRPPAGARPSDGARATPGRRVEPTRPGSGRVTPPPAVRTPPTRSSPPAVRRAPSRSSPPSVRKAPARAKPARPRRPGG